MAKKSRIEEEEDEPIADDATITGADLKKRLKAKNAAIRRESQRADAAETLAAEVTVERDSAVKEKEIAVAMALLGITEEDDADALHARWERSGPEEDRKSFPEWLNEDAPKDRIAKLILDDVAAQQAEADEADPPKGKKGKEAPANGKGKKGKEAEEEEEEDEEPEVTSRTRREAPPSNRNARAQGSAKKVKFTTEQIANMSTSEYAKHAETIRSDYANEP